MQTTGIIAAIVALVVGLVAGYATWGTRSRTLSDELAQVQSKLEETRKAAVEEGAMATKIQELEGKLKQATEDLTKESELRARLEKLATARKKK